MIQAADTNTTASNVTPFPRAKDPAPDLIWIQVRRGPWEEFVRLVREDQKAARRP